MVEGAIASGEAGIQKAEAELDEGQIEESIQAAEDELSLTNKMLEWKPSVSTTLILFK